MDSFWKNRIPDPEIRKSGKTGNSGKMHVTYQIKALDVLVNLDSLKFRNMDPENLEKPDSRSGKMYTVQRGAGASQKAAEGRILASIY